MFLIQSSGECHQLGKTVLHCYTCTPIKDGNDVAESWPLWLFSMVNLSV